MKQRLLRLTAMLMFGCMIASSIPTGTVLAEESAQAADSAGTVQEQTETPDAGTEDPAQSSGQSDSTGAAAQDSETEGAADAGENSDVRTGDGAAAAEDSAVDESGTSDEDTDESAAFQKNAETQAEVHAQEDGAEEQEPVSEAASQEDSVIEKNADEINYVFVESPYLETPGTERIAVSYGDGSETVSDASLTVRDDAGQEAEWELSVSAGQVYLFTYDFADESSTGTYEVISLNVTDEEGEKTVLLSDSGMEAYFGVNEEYDGIEELQPVEDGAVEESGQRQVDASVVTIDENGVTQAQDSIADALNAVSAQNASENGISTFSADASSKTRSARSGDIVVALDPGHDAWDAGARGNGLAEEELTLKIANFI